MSASQPYKSTRYWGVSACFDVCLHSCRFRDAVFASGSGGAFLAGSSSPFRAASIWHASSAAAGSALLSGLQLDMEPLRLTAPLTRYPSVLAISFARSCTRFLHIACTHIHLLMHLLVCWRTCTLTHVPAGSFAHSLSHSDVMQSILKVSAVAKSVAFMTWLLHLEAYHDLLRCMLSCHYLQYQ